MIARIIKAGQFLLGAWVNGWILLLWSSLCVLVGAGIGISAAGGAFRSMLQAKGLLP